MIKIAPSGVNCRTEQIYIIYTFNNCSQFVYIIDCVSVSRHEGITGIHDKTQMIHFFTHCGIYKFQIV